MAHISHNIQSVYDLTLLKCSLLNTDIKWDPTISIVPDMTISNNLHEHHRNTDKKKTVHEEDGMTAIKN